MSNLIKDFLKNSINPVMVESWQETINPKDYLDSFRMAVDLLNKKDIKISNTFLSSRVLNHWQKRGLIDDERINGKGWRKFSSSEAIWLGIVRKLRKFGMDFDKIKKVKESLEYPQDFEKLSKFPELDHFISQAKIWKSAFKLLVFESGKSSLVWNEEFKSYIEDDNTFMEDYITIDLTKLIDSDNYGAVNDIDFIDFNITPIEKEISKTLSMEGIRTIVITIKEKEFIITKEIENSSKKEFEALFNSLKYAKAIKIKNGGKAIYKIMEKIKIKK